jgi:hypothetical protein
LEASQIFPVVSPFLEELLFEIVPVLLLDLVARELQVSRP